MVVLVLLASAGAAGAQTPEGDDAPTYNLQPTEQCPPTDIEQLRRVITFVRSQSWAEDPGASSFLLSPDTTTCRVVMKVKDVSPAEEAALEAGGEGRLSIERTKDRAQPSRLPLLLWAVFGGAGLVFLFRRYGRR